MPKVVTIGELLVEIMRESVDRGLKEIGTFVGPFPSGAPAIFIDQVKRLGTDAGIIGGVGNDDFGNCILDRLDEDGVNTSKIKKLDYPSTGTAFVSYFSDGSRKFIYHMENSAAGTIGPKDVNENLLRDAEVLHVSGSALAMDKGMRSALKKSLDIAKNSGTTISFDPNVRESLLKNSDVKDVLSLAIDCSDILIPSKEELSSISGTNDEIKGAEKLLEQSSLVAVKAGGEGCRLYTSEEETSAEAFEVEEIDPTGAGDAFSAGIVIGWLENMNLKDLSVFANAVGAKAVTKMGPMEGLAWRNEIEKMLSEKTN